MADKVFLVLMARGSETMNVPTDKVQQYLDEGWKEISRTPMPVALEVTVSAETPSGAVTAPLPEVENHKGKRK